jgi:hypothetical protein
MIAGFIVQGGGYTFDGALPVDRISKNAGIVNEFANHAKVSGNNASVTQGSQIVQLPASTNLSGVVPGDRIRLMAQERAQASYGWLSFSHGPAGAAALTVIVVVAIVVFAVLALLLRVVERSDVAVFKGLRRRPPKSP